MNGDAKNCQELPRTASRPSIHEIRLLIRPEESNDVEPVRVPVCQIIQPSDCPASNYGCTNMFSVFFKATTVWPTVAIYIYIYIYVCIVFGRHWVCIIIRVSM